MPCQPAVRPASAAAVMARACRPAPAPHVSASRIRDISCKLVVYQAAGTEAPRTLSLCESGTFVIWNTTARAHPKQPHLEGYGPARHMICGGVRGSVRVDDVGVSAAPTGNQDVLFCFLPEFNGSTEHDIG